MGLKIVIVRFLFIAVIYALVIAIGVMGSARADDRTKMRDAFNIEPDIGYGLMTGMNETDRGREHHCWCPPAQIRTSPIRASGSYLGCLTAKRSLGQG